MWCLGLVLCLLSVPSAAQTEEELQMARDKFENALALQTGGDWAGALSLLKEVARVRSTPHVRFNIALCEEHLGNLVAALGDYELAKEDARAAGADDVATEADRRLEALDERIPRLTLYRGAGNPSAVIALDGVPLGDAVLGTPMNVDPGPHTITATAAGHEDFRRTIRLEERQREDLTVDLVPITEAPPLVEPPAPGAVPKAAYVAFGVGALGIVAGGVSYLWSRQIERDLDRRCNDVCTEDERPLYDRGRRLTTAANVGWAVAGGGFIVGAALLLADSSGGRSHVIVPTAPGAVAGLSYAGRF